MNVLVDSVVVAVVKAVALLVAVDVVQRKVDSVVHVVAKVALALQVVLEEVVAADHRKRAARVDTADAVAHRVPEQAQLAALLVKVVANRRVSAGVEKLVDRLIVAKEQ